MISGYRDLTEDDIKAINAIKKQGEELGIIIDALEKTEGYDYRWIAIAKTHLQQGIMAAVRAVAQPTTF